MNGRIPPCSGAAPCGQGDEGGGSMPTVFNAANERAVRKFLKGEIAFMDIYRIIESCMDAHTVLPDPDVSAILEVEKEVYAGIDRL